MSKPKLSIVMATADDWNGVYFTIQALRFYHNVKDVEFIIVDNKPASKAGKHLAKEFRKFQTYTAGVRYIPMSQPEGTAAPRERAIQEATADYVMCIDSHILFPMADTIQKILDWFAKHPNTNDILTGPLVHDTIDDFSTHFDPIWRKEMWGTWGRAWHHQENFSVIEQDGKARYIRIDQGNNVVDLENHNLPELEYAGHEQHLKRFGCTQLGQKDTDEFEIPGNGLGCFAFRKEAWPGFNPDFRGFGGEELYIHQKFRNAGGKAICVGFLKWVHRFGHIEGSKYRLTNFDKCRNYVLGHTELGYYLDPVYDHFVTTGKVSQKEWDSINPEMVHPLALPDVLDKVFDDAQHNPKSYFSKHLPTIKSLASQATSVVDVTRYRETTIALASAKPKKMHSFIYQAANDPLYDVIFNALKEVECDYSLTRAEEFESFEVPQCELLVYKTPHNCDHLTADLAKWSPNVSRWIVLHDTARNGMALDDKKPGYIPQIKEFMTDHSEWFIQSHTNEQTGLTVLGCKAEDKPAKTIKLWTDGGVGTQLSDLMKSLGINPGANCSCRRVANQMDMMGVEEVEKEIDRIVEAIAANYEKWGWKQKLSLFKAGTLALTSGVAWNLSDWSDVPRSLVLLAISREKERLAKVANVA